jgi:hypothetical protein
VSPRRWCSRRDGTINGGSGQNPDTYVLVLEDIDELFAEILAASGINPKYLGVRFDSNTAIKDWYLRENQFR